MKKLIAGLLFLAGISMGFSSIAQVIYVNHAAVGANNGSSWGNAYTSLSDALAAASYGDEIWVAVGTYIPEVIVDVNQNMAMDAREKTFQIPNGVMLYGGFTGVETSKEERDWQANPTILSGDLDHNDVLTDGIPYSTSNVVGFNAYHVVYTVNVDANTGVDGFFIVGGSASPATPLATTDPNLDGAGWFNDLRAPEFASSPTIRNVKFQANYAASEGGAFYSRPGPAGAQMVSQFWHAQFIRNKAGVTAGGIYVGSFDAGNYAPVIRGCEFVGNEAVRRAGGLYLVGDHAIVDSVLFRQNKATAISGGGETFTGSGGAANLVGSNGSFTTCTFVSNSSTGNPTGAYEGGGGGAIHMSVNDVQTSTLGVSAPSFFNCAFYLNQTGGNTAAWGGAVVHLNDAGRLKPDYVNCVFANNQAQTWGGAIANFTRVMSPPSFTPELKPRFTNCTFTANVASVRGGGFYNDGHNMMGTEILEQTVVNTILFNNLSPDGSEAYTNDGNTTFSHSLILFSGGSGAGWNPAIGIDGGNNIDTSPGFVLAADPDGADNTFGTDDDGLRLMASSPAISKGNSAAPGLAGVSIDFRGGPRIIGPAVDMGAYEQAGLIIPDLDIYWLAPWEKINPPCLSCPWGILLADKILSRFDWRRAQLINHGDYAEVRGEIVSTLDKRVTFEVYMRLEKPRDWKAWSRLGRTWIVYTPAALKAALRGHQDWTYWELSDESYFVGTGDIEGRLKLSHATSNYKVGFQFGKGANGWDADLGLGGTFSYSGKVKYRGKTHALKGVGSLNSDAELCTRDCAPQLEAPRQALAIADEPSQKSLLVYPNPARDHIQINTPDLEGEYKVTIFDRHGQPLQEQLSRSTDGNITMFLNNLSPGLYYVRVISTTGVTLNQKVLVDP